MNATPQPLPASLQPYFDCIASLSKQRGYAWAKIEYYMDRWNVKRWKAYYIIRKLRSFGRLVAEEVAGCHEWRLRPVFLAATSFARSFKRKSNESQTKTSDTYIKTDYAMRKETDNTAPPPAQTSPKPVTVTREVVVSQSETNERTNDENETEKNDGNDHLHADDCTEGLRTGIHSDGNTGRGKRTGEIHSDEPTNGGNGGVYVRGAGRPRVLPQEHTVYEGHAQSRRVGIGATAIPAAIAVIKPAEVPDTLVARLIKDVGADAVVPAFLAVWEWSKTAAIESWPAALRKAVAERWKPRANTPTTLNIAQPGAQGSSGGSQAGKVARAVPQERERTTAATTTGDCPIAAKFRMKGVRA